MPLTETITIINNSGKIISTGKHLVNVLKEARAAYQEKRAAVKYERAVRRAQTVDSSAPSQFGPFPFDGQSQPGVYETRQYYYFDDSHESAAPAQHEPRRLSDLRSYASSRRSRTSSRRSRSRSRQSGSRSRPALTESNLRTHSDVVSQAPSATPRSYQTPYAETADMTSRPPTGALQLAVHEPAPTELTGADLPDNNRNSTLVMRSRSDPELRKGPGGKDDDMHLAYGSLPPDLAARPDVVEAHRHERASVEDVDDEPEPKDQQEARTLIGKIESLIEEAQCLHHTATSIISHLQSDPQAAAAVALTLAELSAIVTKFSPAFLSIIKCGSPAVFALLASPQFLVGVAGVVGVTVVMFGGWKIVKRISDRTMSAQAVPAAPVPAPPQLAGPAEDGQAVAVQQIQGPPSVEEALVVDDRLDEELSTIETWRRGIVPFGDNETADLELISPEAERFKRRLRKERQRSRHEDKQIDDTASRASHKTRRSSKSHSSTASKAKGGGSTTSSRHDRDRGVPERKSSKAFSTTGSQASRDDASVASSTASSKRRASHKTDRSEAVFPTSKRPEKVATKAIDSYHDDDAEAALRPKKDNMLKTLFKKKEKDAAKFKAASVLV